VLANFSAAVLPHPVGRRPASAQPATASAKELPFPDMIKGLGWFKGKRFLLEGDASACAEDMRSWGVELHGQLEKGVEFWVTDQGPPDEKTWRMNAPAG